MKVCHLKGSYSSTIDLYGREANRTRGEMSWYKLYGAFTTGLEEK